MAKKLVGVTRTRLGTKLASGMPAKLGANSRTVVTAKAWQRTSAPSVMLAAAVIHGGSKGMKPLWSPAEKPLPHAAFFLLRKYFLLCYFAKKHVSWEQHRYSKAGKSTVAIK